MSPALRVPATALMNPNTPFTRPPGRLIGVHRRSPRSPMVHVCGGVLYCTITLTGLEGLPSRGRRSGEIFELSVRAVATVMRTSHNTANLATPFANFKQNDCIAKLWH